MKNILVITACLSFAASLQAQILVDATFDGVGYSTYGGSADLNPNTGSGGASPVVFRMSMGDSNFTIASDALSLNRSSNQFGANVPFAGYTLANANDSISAEVDISYTGGDAGSFGFYWGLVDSTVNGNGGVGSFPIDGVVARVGLGAGAGVSSWGIYDGVTGWNNGPSSDLGFWTSSLTSSPARLGITLTRNLDSSLELVYSINGSDVSTNTLSSSDVPTYLFDTVSFYHNSSNPAGGAYTIDNLTVSASQSVTPVPEPSAFALLAGILTLGLVIIRRRRK